MLVLEERGGGGGGGGGGVSGEKRREPATNSSHIHSFLYTRVLFFRPRLKIIILFFFQAENILELFLIINYGLWHYFTLQNVLGLQLPVFLQLSERNNLIRLNLKCTIVPYLHIFKHKIESFFTRLTLSLGCILRMILKFRKFQPRHSYRKKGVYGLDAGI